MDVDALFPNGFHPVKLNLDPTARRPAKQLARRRVQVKYYFTSFYPSCYYVPSLAINPGQTHDEPLCPPEMIDLDPAVSCLRQLGSLDKVNVWHIGQLFRTKLLNVSRPLLCPARVVVFNVSHASRYIPTLIF